MNEIIPFEPEIEVLTALPNQPKPGMMNIHYSTVTGEIMSFGNADHIDGEDSHFPDCKILVIPLRGDIGVGTHVVDLATLELIPNPKPRQPQQDYDPMFQLKFTIVSELTASDKYMMADYPMSESDRVLWTSYRKGLRDASKGNTTLADIVKALPKKPNGSDAFTRFREPSVVKET